MSSSDLFKHYVATTELYDAIDQHGCPTYLQRNVHAVLDGHARELRRLQAKRAGQPHLPSPNLRRDGPMVFHLPPKGALEAAVQQTDHHTSHPRLEIRPRSLERFNTEYSNVEAPNLDWLSAFNRIPITCVLQFGYKSLSMQGLAEDSSKQHIVEKRYRASLIRKKDIHGQIRFLLDSEKPFYINQAELWKNNEIAAKHIKIFLNFDDIEDSIDFESELGGEDEPLSEPLQLFMIWRELRAPYLEGTLLKASRVRNGANITLPGWGFRVDVAWSEPSKTALEIYNQDLNECLRNLKTADDKAEDNVAGDIERQQQFYCIKYVLTGDALQSRVLFRNDLKCVHCNSRSPFPQFNSLFFHYVVHHALFSFRVSNEHQRTGEIMERTIHIDMAELQRERASNHVLDEREVDWVMPEEPLDIEKYLYEHDRSWVNYQSKNARQRDEHEERPRGTFTEPVNGTVLVNQQLVLTETVDDIPELPSKTKKRFLVPKVSGVTLRRTSSKRVVQAGEWLSESDEDADDSWLRLRQKSRRVNDASCQLTGLYNAHMASEGPLANIHLPHAIVRFTRRHRENLNHPAMLTAFKTKLDHLKLRRYLTEHTKASCLELLQDSLDDHMAMGRTDTVTGQAGPITLRNDHSTHSTANDTGRLSIGAVPIASGMDRSYAPTRDASCMCGKACTTAKGVIYCSNARCLRKGFHLPCVGLARRVPQWQCPDCKTAVVGPAAPVAVMT